MGGGGSSEDNPVSLNVTAMVDIIFCLCLFFMCSFHFKQLQGKIDSWLPKDVGVNAGQPDNTLLEEIRVVITNDNWNQGTLVADLRAATALVGGFALPENSKDAAVIISLDPGAYTVQIADSAGRSGVSLAEVYEVP